MSYTSWINWKISPDSSASPGLDSIFLPVLLIKGKWGWKICRETLLVVVEVITLPSTVTVKVNALLHLMAKLKLIQVLDLTHKSQKHQQYIVYNYMYAHVWLICCFCNVFVNTSSPLEVPRVSVEPRNQTFTTGEEVRIRCSASGYPPPRLVWTHNDMFIMASSR